MIENNLIKLYGESMSQKQSKNPVGRPSLSKNSETTNDGYTTTVEDLEKLDALIANLNRRGFSTNKSEFIRLAIREGMKSPARLYRNKKRKVS